MPRVKVILNPAADRGHAAVAGEAVRQVMEEEAGRAAGSGQPFELVWEQTGYPGHAVELAARTADEGFEGVVAIGGDGTVHEIINGLMQIPAAQRPWLSIVPVGSGNDFAHNLGLPADPLEAARLFTGNARLPVDVGAIEDEHGRREFWNNTIGIGFSGAVNIATRKYPRVRGFMSYFVAVLDTIFLAPTGFKASLTIDDQPTRSLSISMLSLCNGPREGGGFPVAPGARLDDGLISYTILRRISRVMMLRFLPVVMSGRHLNHPRYFEGGTARRIHIQADAAMAVHTDGEVFGPWEANLRQLEVSIVPGAVCVTVPARPV